MLFNVILAGLRSAVMHIIGKTLTKKFFVWLLLYVAEAGVKSTKNTYDDKLFEKVKAAVNENRDSV